MNTATLRCIVHVLVNVFCLSIKKVKYYAKNVKAMLKISSAEIQTQNFSMLSLLLGKPLDQGSPNSFYLVHTISDVFLNLCLSLNAST